jgi:hypothetical protein
MSTNDERDDSHPFDDRSVIEFPVRDSMSPTIFTEPEDHNEEDAAARRALSAPEDKDVDPEATFALGAIRGMSAFGGELRILSPAGAAPAGTREVEPPTLIEGQFVMASGSIVRWQMNRSMCRMYARLLGDAVKDGDAAWGSETW